MADPSPPDINLSLSAKLEALLFVAPGAVAPAQLAVALKIPVNEVEKGLVELESQVHQGGLRLQRHQGWIQLTTTPEAAPLVERFLGLEATRRLSRAALDTLAIIAYQQPVTRPEVDAIRGVNSDGVLKSLRRRILYNNTTDFLQHFGLNSLTDLPPFTPVVEDDGQSDFHDQMLKS